MPLEMPSACFLLASGFASLWMLSFAAAGAIPLLIHLLTRRRQQQVKWAAMQLLQQVLERETKRIRFEQLLLLLIRILILVWLAFTMARPFLTDYGASATSGRAPKLFIIAIDTSYSMKYRQDGTTRLQSAKNKAAELIDTAVEGDAFALIELNEPTRAIIQRPTFDRERVLAEIRKLSANDMSSEIADGVEIAQRLLSNARQSDDFPSQAHTIFLSDLGKEAWEELSQRDQPIRQLGQRSSFEAISVNESSVKQPVRNLAVSDISCENYDTVVGKPLTIRVQLHNYSNQAANSIPIELQVDGQTIDSRKIDLAAGADQNETFQWQPRVAGSAALTVSIDSGDGLSADDTRSCVVGVRERYRVLFAEERANSSRLMRLGLEAGLGRGTLQLETCSLRALDQQDLSQWDVVVINNPARLSNVTEARLSQFVEAGGGMLLGLGPAAQPNHWANEPTSELLGFQLQSISTEELWAIDPLDYQSPVVSVFAGFPDTGLLTTPVFRYWMVEKTSPTLRVDLAFANGDPFIVRHRYGDGWVASVLSAPENVAEQQSGSQRWNSIATWPSFVPLMQRLLITLLDSSHQRFTLPCGALMSGLTPTLNADPIEILEPNGNVISIAAEKESDAPLFRWFFARTQHAGLYTASYTTGSAETFALNLDAKQSSLESLPPQSILRIEGKEPAGETQRVVADANLGAKLARNLLFILLGLLIAESLTAWFIGQRIG